MSFRRKASYFNVGDIILYGRWKNHKARIVAFGQDKHGNPTVEIEPIPKGRKKNKVLGLFKIWHQLPEVEVKEASDCATIKRVVARFLNLG